MRQHRQGVHCDSAKHGSVRDELRCNFDELGWVGFEDWGLGMKEKVEWLPFYVLYGPLQTSYYRHTTYSLPSTLEPLFPPQLILDI